MIWGYPCFKISPYMVNIFHRMQLSCSSQHCHESHRSHQVMVFAVDYLTSMDLNLGKTNISQHVLGEFKKIPCQVSSKAFPWYPWDQSPRVSCPSPLHSSTSKRARSSGRKPWKGLAMDIFLMIYFYLVIVN